MSYAWIGLVAYAVLLTVILVMAKRHSNEGVAIEELRRLADAVDDPKLRISALSEAEKLRQAANPWWEKSLSTIGVLAFFSMSLAAGIQTVNASVASGRVERWKAEVEALKVEHEAAQALIRTSTSVVLDRYHETGRLDHSGREVLRYRSEALARLHEPEPGELAEEYEVSLVLGDFQRAVAALTRNIELLDETKAADRLSLAEYYYLTGATNTAKEMLRTVEAHLSAMPWQLRMRAIVLKTALGSDWKEGTRELAQLLRIGSDEAGARLQAEVSKLSRAHHEGSTR